MDPERSSSGQGTGLYLSAGWSWESLELKLDDRAALPSRDIQWEEWGPGFSFGIGYGFGPGFRAETSLVGTWREASPEGAQAGSGVARFTGYVPLRTRSSLQPHLIGGMNASAAFFRTRGESDLVYLMVGGELGAGVRAILNRHWAVQFDYTHAIHNLELEFVEAKGDKADTKNVGRRGWSDALRVGVTYDF